jgi:hypothetical protein
MEPLTDRAVAARRYRPAAAAVVAGCAGGVIRHPGHRDPLATLPLPAASDDAEQQAAQGEVVSGFVAFGDLIAASAASEYPGGGQREELIAACFPVPMSGS